MPVDAVDRIKLEIAAICIREFLNNMGTFPDLYVEVYRSSLDRGSRIELSDQFFTVIGKERVFALESGGDQRTGVSVFTIYLNKMKYIENGVFHFAIFEQWNLWLNYLHEFKIFTKEDEIKSVEFLLSTEL